MGTDEKAGQELVDSQPGSEEERTALFFQIRNLPVPDRVKLALTGNQEVRRILIADATRTVQVAVLKNPRITEAEVAQIALSKTVHDDVLRQIVNTREWVRHYSIKLALVKNPRTPVQTSIRFLPYLRDRDLMEIQMNRNVPNPVRVHAKMTFSKRRQ